MLNLDVMRSLSKQAPAPLHTRPRATSRWSIGPGLWFLAGFLFFNLTLFLPGYLLDAQNAAFLPRGSWGRILLARENADIFRLNLEISLLLLIFLVASPRWRASIRVWYARGFFAVYLLALIYAIYESVTLNLYHTSPVLFNDYRFLLSGIGLLVDALQLTWWRLVFLAAILLTLIFLLYKLTMRWFDHAPAKPLGRGARIAAWARMIALLGFALLQTSALARPETEVNSLTAKLIANARASRQARQELAAYDSIRPEDQYNYSQTTRLLRRPNIYLIFIESYGSVLYKRAHFEDAYRDLMTDMQARLEGDGWAAATGLSASPTWGGGSWMAYTSAEFGLRIASQPQFLAVRDRYSIEPYPSLGRYLQSQGYLYARLSPIQRSMGQTEEAANAALYGADRWIEFSDLDYQGPLYGWGPAPPDQFSLHKARALLDAGPKQPRFLVYLTQNSHYPWAPLPSLVKDWRTLDNANWPSPSPIGEPISHRDNIKHYREAIRYQWEALSEFILATPADENAIFILIGDHQPPRVSRRADGFETPIHIIARDADFVDRFLAYGFDSGLLVGNLHPDMRHEGLYSMLVRELVGAYGVSQTPIPYLPDGIHLDIPTSTSTPTPISPPTHKETSP